MVDISVILPVYNSARYLECSINSILTQSYKNFELLIVYDSSQDNSEEIISKFANLDERVKIIYGNSNGLSSALNLGIQHASGKYVARMDADDVSRINRFELQMKALKHYNANICGCSFDIIDSNSYFLKHHNVPLRNENIFMYICCGSPFPHPGVIFEKKILVDNKLQYGSGNFPIIEDYNLWADLLSTGNVKAINVNCSMIKYRLHNQSISIDKRVKSLIACHKLSIKFFLDNYFTLKNYYDYDVDNNKDIDSRITFALYCLFLKGDFRYIYVSFLRFPFIRIIESSLRFFKRKILYIYYSSYCQK